MGEKYRCAKLNLRWSHGVFWQVQISKCFQTKARWPIGHDFWLSNAYAINAKNTHVDCIRLASRLLDFVHANPKTKYSGVGWWNFRRSEQTVRLYILFAVLRIDQFATLQPISAPHGSFDQQLQEPTDIDGHDYNFADRMHIFRYTQFAAHFYGWMFQDVMGKPFVHKTQR